MGWVDRVAGPRRLPEKGLKDENRVQEEQGRYKMLGWKIQDKKDTLDSSHSVL